jgi:2-amino-4-hydroxy-6-hydroxymethyldihydropteridine diphosphokinase
MSEAAGDQPANRVVVVLGSNIQPEHNIRMAVALLRQLCQVRAVSPVYETVPAGLAKGPNFLNAAALLETELDARRLKEEVLARIEQELQRQRLADKNAPRTIDADIALFNDDVFELGHRHIPDPDLLRYPHVAVPAADVLPEWRHPETGETLATIATRLVAEATAAGRAPLWPRPDLTP